ncbi:MAG: Na+/H+ antiporter NhaC family protein [Candidatus Glassbacteria bacterium]|nr:Na+/H+ antiporter NhaC family protein [Candidatus Glassbacteria bacterium]
MTSQVKPLSFRGGALTSVVPLAVFLAATVALVLTGKAEVEGMVLAAMLGISLGMIFVRSAAEYSERVFSLMANRIGTVAVVCWLWAGAFSGILADSGLVEAIVWVGWKLDLTGRTFTLAVFIASSLFAVSTGSGLGTVVGFTTVMYPAGIVLGANPPALMGAILSGAAFGDNLAPVSDTTIVSAATQETDVGGVVRSRLKYSLIAAAVSCILFLVFGGGRSAVDPGEAASLLAETADPTGLPMLIPGLVVFIAAVSGLHFLAALNIGIAAAMVTGAVTGIFPLEHLLQLNPGGGSLAGSALSGALAMLPISILALLLVTANGLMEAGGFLELVMDRLHRTAARSVRAAETAIVALISLANIFVPVNTIAMVTVGPLANRLRKSYQIHPYRSANLLDTISCSFPFILPYAAVIVAASAIQAELARRYDFVSVLPWASEAPFVFYSIVLFPVMILAVITGFGRKKG